MKQKEEQEVKTEVEKRNPSLYFEYKFHLLIDKDYDLIR